MSVRAALSSIGSRPFLFEENEEHSGDDLLRSSHSLAEALRAGPHSRFLVSSAKACRVIRALVAGEITRV